MAGHFNIRQLADGSVVCKAHNLEQFECKMQCFKNQDHFLRGIKAARDALGQIEVPQAGFNVLSHGYDEHPAPVDMLIGNAARFIPQIDVELLGNLAATAARTNFNYDTDIPGPLAPGALVLEACEDCGLTWLRGKAGTTSIKKHPQHHSYVESEFEKHRTIVVHAHGAISGAGEAAVVGVGVCYCSAYAYGDVSETPAIGHRTVWTKDNVALAAAFRALFGVFVGVLSRLREVHKGWEERRELQQFRVVVATDSRYVVESMCMMGERWIVEESEGKVKGEAGKVVRKKKNGEEVKNSQGLIHAYNMVDWLARRGVQVQWCLVDSKANKEAESLAKKAIKECKECMK